MPLILHIGMQKTGTSSIQQFLDGNVAKLHKAGILYPELKIFSDIIFPGVSYHNCIVAALNNGTSPFPSVSEKDLDKLRSIIQSTHETVLLSAEDFSRFVNFDGVKKLIDGIDTKVIVYLREQTAWVQSLYNQRNKILFSRMNDRFWSEDILARENLFKFLSEERYQRMLDYNKLFDRWVNVVGEGNVDVRIYSRDQLKGGDVVEDFASYLGIEDTSDFRKYPRTNENLANAWINMFRNIASEHGENVAKQIAQEIAIANTAGKVSLAGDINFLSRGVVVKMRNNYAESNAQLARKVFGRNDLFHNNKSEEFSG